MIQKVGIIGSGISGLSSYYYLRNGINLTSKFSKNNLKINIFEKSNKVGGNIQTRIIQGKNKDEKIIVEEGPRSLRALGRGLNTLEFIKRLGISNDIIFSSANSNGKFVLLDGKPKEIPMTSLFDIIKFSFKHSIVSSILKEPFKKVPSQVKEMDPNWDESVHDFFSRRLGKTMTKTFIEPTILGIYGGDYTNLSIKSTFKRAALLEPFGGLILGSLFKSKKQKQFELDLDKNEKRLLPSKNELTELFDKDTDKTNVFSFKENGLSRMIQKLKSLIESDSLTKLYLSTSIVEIEKDVTNGTLKVTDNKGNQYQYDQLISTIPLNQLAPMFKKSDSKLYQLLQSVNYTSIAVINLIYKSNKNVVKIISDKGFGYLVPSKENQSVIGVCFDSNTFPEFVNNNNNNNNDNDNGNEKDQSIITVMIGGNNGIKDRNDNWIDVTNTSKDKLLDIALKHLDKVLDIESSPDFTNVSIYDNGIPHYNIGHQNLINEIQNHITKNYGTTLLLGGNSIDGVGINDSIHKSKQLINSLKLSNN
ncbi:protoporphyrinogen oxidase [Dictyostelium discoideum AX4]|uniref:Protoporphyrinogen oxidase n=1 Tax=Dictyostelium discoideum TaxID=44689 RepID=PPOX_DICDI|nr:protoporphyrinogen oxidase [Dictyostelium discoideum AX4]Q54DT8.1 RecName: Full=Protoporphyrinogen oxidase; Short=PPO [Dictyostelium discoideum]EAL61376.1 protoporphyrinogen oxidase [Dictyostelium discoideum AX4]|eukprot:XP_629784.1 protoporphyrinogen oxidase [Dictyostelium discoideum AX4]